MAEGKSENETWLNYTIKPYAKHFFGTISSVQQLAKRDWHVFSVQNLYEHMTIYLPFSMHSNHRKVRSFDVPWQQFNKLLQQLLALYTLHTVGSNKSACVLSV